MTAPRPPAPVRGAHRLVDVLEVPLPVDEVFTFFSDAGNLERITPPELGFQIVTRLPIDIRQGTIIDYRLRLFGMPFGWRSEVTRWEPPHAFVDEARRGPYHTWIHLHRFEPSATGTRITDEVTYRLPLWPAGDLALPLVRLQLGRIFRYRQAAVRRLLVEGDTQAG